jgi:hypothetical protein
MDTSEEFMRRALECEESYDYENGLINAMRGVIMYDYEHGTGDNPRGLALKQMAQFAARMEEYSLASHLFMMSLGCDKSCGLKGGICALLDGNYGLATFAHLHPRMPEADKALLINLIQALKENNVESFSAGCAARDQIESLDPLVTTLLLRLKCALNCQTYQSEEESMLCVGTWATT